MQRHDLLLIAVVMFAIVIGIFTGAFIFILPVVAIAFTIAGFLSCIKSNKKTNTKLLWVIMIILAPFLGPLLWFVWGKKQAS
jgi:hypothetical protein